MIKILFINSAVLLAFSLSVQAQPAGYNPEEAMKALGMLMGGGSDENAEPVQTIHFRQLKTMVPEEIDGMKRTSVEAGKNAAFGMNISYANADYKNDQGSISVKIQDISAMSGYMKMAQFAWASQEMERESDSGYERTTKIDGFAAKESFRYSGKSSDIELIVDERFMVELNGRGIEMEQVKNFVKALNLKKLAELKPEESE